MKMFSAFLVGAAAALFATYLFLVTTPELRVRSGKSGTTVTIKFANPNGPDPSSVPAAPSEEPTPVPAPESSPLADAPAVSQPAPAPAAAPSSPAAAGKPQPAAKPASKDGPAGKPPKDSTRTEAAAAKGPAQTARAGQGGNAPVRVIIKKVPVAVPCPKDNGESPWSRAGQPERR